VVVDGTVVVVVAVVPPDEAGGGPRATNAAAANNGSLGNGQVQASRTTSRSAAVRALAEGCGEGASAVATEWR